MAIKKNELYSSLWASCDELRGGMDASQYKDYVLVLLINRRNIRSGTTTVHDLDKRALGSFTLTDPLDAALVDDARCYHGVTPVEPENPALPAYRDVLVVTFRKKD